MIAKTKLAGLEPAAVVTSLTVHPDGIVRAGLDRELPLMTDVYIIPPAAPTVQEPVGYWLIGTDHVEFEKHSYHDGPEWEAIYTNPPAAPVQQRPLFADIIAQHPGLAEELKAMDAAPAAQRQWVGLTDDEIDSVQHQYIQQMMPGPRHFARAIEDKLREKNS